MIFNFLNSNLCAVILKDWVMITLFCTFLFHWWIWSSRFFVSDLVSFVFIRGLNFLIMHFVLYNFCLLLFSGSNITVSHKKKGTGCFWFLSVRVRVSVFDLILIIFFVCVFVSHF